MEQRICEKKQNTTHASKKSSLQTMEIPNGKRQRTSKLQPVVAIEILSKIVGYFKPKQQKLMLTLSKAFHEEFLGTFKETVNQFRKEANDICKKIFVIGTSVDGNQFGRDGDVREDSAELIRKFQRKYGTGGFIVNEVIVNIAEFGGELQMERFLTMLENNITMIRLENFTLGQFKRLRARWNHLSGITKWFMGILGLKIPKTERIWLKGMICEEESQLNWDWEVCEKKILLEAFNHAMDDSDGESKAFAYGKTFDLSIRYMKIIDSQSRSVYPMECYWPHDSEPKQRWRFAETREPLPGKSDESIECSEQTSIALDAWIYAWKDRYICSDEDEEDIPDRSMQDRVCLRMRSELAREGEILRVSRPSLSMHQDEDITISLKAQFVSESSSRFGYFTRQKIL